MQEALCKTYSPSFRWELFKLLGPLEPPARLQMTGVPCSSRHLRISVLTLLLIFSLISLGPVLINGYHSQMISCSFCSNYIHGLTIPRTVSKPSSCFKRRQAWTGKFKWPWRKLGCAALPESSSVCSSSPAVFEDGGPLGNFPVSQMASPSKSFKNKVRIQTAQLPTWINHLSNSLIFLSWSGECKNP